MKELTNKIIKEFLEEAPLYSWKTFKKPKINRADLWIKEIDAFCETCKKNRPFFSTASRGGGSGMSRKALSTGKSCFEFACVSCHKEYYTCSLEHIVNEEVIKLQKFGELPRRCIERDIVLQKFFADDIDCYEKAVVCLSHGYGIAAFSYLRRIIENNILKLLDLLQEDIETSKENNEIKKSLSELRKELPMSEKIRIANKALPVYLKPDGLNPLGRLYKVLSEGVHNHTDQECLQRANAVKECLKYLISELSSRKKIASILKAWLDHYKVIRAFLRRESQKHIEGDVRQPTLLWGGLFCRFLSFLPRIHGCIFGWC